MRGKLAFLVCAGLLAACGSSDGGGSGGTPPPPGATFSVVYSPTSSAFKVARNSSATLTVTVTINSSSTKAVLLNFIASGVNGLGITPSVTTITGSGSTTVTVTTTANVDSKPYFTVKATGLDKNGNTRDQNTFDTTFQWTTP